MCSLCWLVRWFRDWPFVYFSGGFISHLFGDYANINMWKSDYMKAWNYIRNDCGRFVKNQMQRPLKNKRYQETGKEYFTTVQMIVKDEGYKYFATKATFDAWSCPPSPPSAPQTHTHTHAHTHTHTHTRTHAHTYTKRTLCVRWILPIPPPAHTTLFPIPITTNAQVFLSHNCLKRKENLFHKSWNFT